MCVVLTLKDCKFFLFQSHLLDKQLQMSILYYNCKDLLPTYKQLCLHLPKIKLLVLLIYTCAYLLNNQ